MNTETLNVSSAKVPEFAGATDLEEVSGKKSGNWLLSFLKEHLDLSIAGGIILLLGIILFLFDYKGEKVKNEMKTWITDFQIYNNYGSNVYKAVITTDDANKYYCSDQCAYIYDFADKVIVLSNIYNIARYELENSSSMDPEDIKKLRLMMLAAARELEYISSEVMSKTKHDFFKNRIQKLHPYKRNIENVWAEFGIDARAFFYDDMYCKYLVQAIVIEVDLYRFVDNDFQGLNNLVNELSARIEILKNLDPLSLNENVKEDKKYFTYEPKFPVIKDVPMSNIKLGWNACFKSGNEPFGFDGHRIYSLRLICYRITRLLNSHDVLQPESQDNKQLLENLLRQCKAKSDSLLSNSAYLQLEPEIEPKFQNYVDNNADLSYNGFIQYCEYEGCAMTITLQMKKNIISKIIDTIIDRKLAEPNLGNNMGTLNSNLGTLLSNENLREQLNFDPDDCERIKALLAVRTI